MATTIPMVDLKGQYHALRQELDAAIAGVLESARFVLGPNVEAFEHEVARHLGVAHAVSCASGTDALQLALAALGVGPGDEVITTPFTFVATAEAICHVGATPVFADIDARTFNLDAAAVEAAITPCTAAVVVVHLFGQPADTTRLRALCERGGLLLVEDCAQSFGARVDGVATGAIGACGCFSFFPSKNLGCFGDGGLVTTGAADVATRLRALRNHGSSAHYHHDMVGYNSRLDELQAAILRVKLRHVDRFNAARRAVAARYTELLAGMAVAPPCEAPRAMHVYHQYTVLCAARERLRAALASDGIASAVHYPLPLHRQPAFADQCAGQSLPVAEAVARRCLSLPMYPELPHADVARIVGVIASALR
ncbi:MAG TPA: DegT/DnrJ/EryC1/StrS family aminotransferase [Rhodocyclaceae bacterium]|nr:DegT/DnrJ/EryC1/StrS family aminotransferase [Rhodocyclaceae bacterium]